MALLTMSLTLPNPSSGSSPSSERSSLFAPDRVIWSELDFKASKLFLSATTEVELEQVPAASITADLMPTQEVEALPPAGDSVLEMTLRSRGLGRDSEILLWFTADTRALQRTQHESGKKHDRHVVYRFGRQGVERRRWEPETDAEIGLPYLQWTDVTESCYPYPDGTARGRPVLEPSALLWVASASDLEVPGDRLELLAFSDKQLTRVEVTVEEVTSLRVDYLVQSPRGSHRVEGPVEVLRLSLEGSPVVAGGENDFEFLGLSGNLDLYLDRATRVPVEVSGKVKYAGRLRVKLQRAKLHQTALR